MTAIGRIGAVRSIAPDDCLEQNVPVETLRTQVDERLERDD